MACADRVPDEAEYTLKPERTKAAWTFGCISLAMYSTPVPVGASAHLCAETV